MSGRRAKYIRRVVKLAAAGDRTALSQMRQYFPTLAQAWRAERRMYDIETRRTWHERV